jgi:hypothetical protein
VIAATGTTPDAIVRRLNKRATATSYGVAVADLLRGYELPA